MNLCARHCLALSFVVISALYGADFTMDDDADSTSISRIYLAATAARCSHCLIARATPLSGIEKIV